MNIHCIEEKNKFRKSIFINYQKNININTIHFIKLDIIYSTL